MLLIVFMPIFANVQPGHWFVAQLKTRNFAILLYVCAYIECYKRWAVPSWYCDDFLPVYFFVAFYCIITICTLTICTLRL